ncbi:uncharacterized protein LOC111641512 [Centruroides sculpturatus]|uniref:uncharacterized protein LOC111641512 n=1 Tax=Centruroides sculpturatus TaxID=218467 RepID=UPI000C6D8192|nr:uncharacterized protein LOC111641512 [Centruroides sculpturatus]
MLQMLTEAGKNGNIPLENIMNPLCCGLSSKNWDVVIKSLIALQHLYSITTLSLYPFYPRFFPILLQLKRKLDVELRKECTECFNLKRKLEIEYILHRTIDILYGKPGG